jgi:hypothetical protein
MEHNLLVQQSRIQRDARCLQEFFEVNAAIVPAVKRSASADR